MKTLENLLEAKHRLTLVSVRARCNSCGNEYTFFASSSRAQLSCPACQEVSRKQFKLAERGGWRYAVQRWLDRFVFKVTILSFLSELADRFNR